MQPIIDTSTREQYRRHRSIPAPAGIGSPLHALRHRLKRRHNELRIFLRAVHEPDYLAAKARHFAGFTCLALLVTAVFFGYANVWDLAIDPAGHAQTLGLRVLECGLILFLALLTGSNVSARTARVAFFAVPLIVEAVFIQVLSVLDGGSTYGMGGFLYFFIFVPVVVLAQPLLFAAAVLVAITVLPPLAATFGLSAGLDWGVYNAYMWAALVPVLCILALFEYLYWTVFCYQRQIEAQASTDALTGLANRRHFVSTASSVLALHRRYRRPVSLLFIDIDRFKTINDVYGHCAGDAAIRHVAQRLRTPLRVSDRIARYGGEEFVVLLPETGESVAACVAERMRTALAEAPGPAACPGIGLTVSIGIASQQSIAGEAIDIDTLVRRADRALYEAKHRGRDRVVRAGNACASSPIGPRGNHWPSRGYSYAPSSAHAEGKNHALLRTHRHAGGVPAAPGRRLGKP